MIDDRIAARRREVRDHRRQRRLRRTLVLGGVAVLLLAFVAIERSALVAVEDIEVIGLHRLSEEQVEDAAAIELGTSTLRLKLGDAAERVADLPLVRDASARRADPLTVVIEVVEREPVLVAAGGDRRVLVDRDGVVIAEGSMDGLAVVELAEAPPPPGDTVAAQSALGNAHAVWRGLSGPLRAQVRRLAAPSADDLELALASGIDVRFGRADRVDEKVRALGAVLEDVTTASTEELETGAVTHIDVRAPGAPVVTAN